MKSFVLDNKEGYITLEFTNHCNLDCVMCETGKLPVKKRSHLDFSAFKSIIDQLANSQFKAGTLVPFWLGEPTLNPKFYEMVDYICKKLPDIALEIHTNGTFLSNKLLQFKGIRRIVLSLDASTKTTYDKVRRNGDFDRVIGNIKEFIKARKWKNPLLVFQFIAMEGNSFEKQSFIEFWQKNANNPKVIFNEKDYPENGDCIFIRKLDTSSIYAGEAKAVFSSASNPIIGKSEYFNLIIPYFRVVDKIPRGVYNKLEMAPESLIKRCKNFLDLNQPNANYNLASLAEMVDSNTRLNIGFSSADNFDNLLDVFSKLKTVDPLVKNIQVFDGERPTQSGVVDELISLNDFSWERIGSLSNSFTPLKSEKRVLIVMPSFQIISHQIIESSKEFKKLQEVFPLSKCVDLNKTGMSELLKRIENSKFSRAIILNTSIHSNAVELGLSLSKKIKVSYWDPYYLGGIQFDMNLGLMTFIQVNKKPMLISPRLFSQKNFPYDLHTLESSILQGLANSGIDVKYFNSNINDEIELFKYIEEKNPPALFITHSTEKTDTFGLVQRIRSRFANAKIILIEKTNALAKKTSYKQGVDLVLSNIEWDSFPLWLLLFGKHHFMNLWYQNEGLKEKYSLLEFQTSKKDCVIISGKKSNQNPNIGAIAKILESQLFGGINGKRILVIPRLFKFNAKEIQDAHFQHPELQIIDLNVISFEELVNVSKNASVVFINNFTVSNNCFDIAEKLSGRFKKIIIEHDSTKLRDSASMKGVDFVVKLNSPAFWEKFPSLDVLTLPGIGFRYGDSIIVNDWGEKNVSAPSFNFTSGSSGKTLVLGPKLFGITKFPEKALLLEGTILKTLEKGMYLNA